MTAPLYLFRSIGPPQDGLESKRRRILRKIIARRDILGTAGAGREPINWKSTAMNEAKNVFGQLSFMRGKHVDPGTTNTRPSGE